MSKDTEENWEIIFFEEFEGMVMAIFYFLKKTLS